MLTLDDLQRQLRQSLQGWRLKLEKAGIATSYALLASYSLWPILAAYQQGQFHDTAGLMALGALLSNLGVNVVSTQLTNQLEKWRGEIDSEEKLAQGIEALPASSPLRADLDAMLDKLNVLELARASLSEADKVWFGRTIGDEFRRLGHFKDHQVQIEGDWNVVVQGDQNNVDIKYEKHEHYYAAPSKDEEEQRTRAAARRRYLTRLRRECSVLPLAALGGDEGGEDELTLDRVYIALDTTTRVPLTDEEKQSKTRRRSAALRAGGSDEDRALTALEAGAQSPHLALLGDPGSGKSTFVRRLVAELAASHLESGPPPIGLAAGALPILLVLRDLAPRLEAIDVDDPSTSKQKDRLVAAVRDLIVEELQRLEVAELADEMREALETGKCLLVLDGLDEVPHDLRRRVRQAVAALLERYPVQRVILTCRVRSYVGETVFPNFHQHILAPFDAERVRGFATAWYNAQKTLGRFDSGQAETKAADLAQAALSPDLSELSSNPMMLTTMAIVHQREIGLPRERVRLYSLAVEVLLRRWQKGKTGALADFLKDDLRLRMAMERLAYEAHLTGRGEQGVADVPRGAALIILEGREYLNDTGLAGQFLDYVDQRAGLLVGRGGELGKPATYSFPHRTFQEYLAGCYLTGQRDAVRLSFAHAAEGDDWNLAVQLGAEDLHYNRRNPNAVLDLAYRLCPAEPPASSQQRRALSWSGNLAALSGRENIEHDPSPDGGAQYFQRLIPRLVDLLASDLSAPERAEAGRALAKLGDPRPEVLAVDAMPFCYVPGGPFLMGNNRDPHSEADEDEAPQHEVSVPAFYGARFLVSNGQYAEFVAAGGYDLARYWTEAETAGFWNDGVFKGRWDNEPRRGLYDHGEPFNLLNHPAVGASWYEALAFARWLTERWQAHGWLAKDWHITQPSEAEWEKLARGGLQVPASPMVIEPRDLTRPTLLEKIKNELPARRYPWDDEFNSNLANTNEAGIGASSTLGCFVGGESVYGAQDLAGNVWEWTRSHYKAYPYVANDGREDLKAPDDVRRVLRGGSFASEARYARCASRYGIDPNLRSDNLGFRVVAVPFRL